MDFYVARAMQIAGMDTIQITDLHDIERKRGYCLPNWNIQSIFHLQPIKERWTIPDEGLEAHGQRIRGVLLSQRIAHGDEYKAVDKDGNEITVAVKPWENITTGRVDATHQFDAAVYDAIQEGKISFGYEGAATTGTRLRDRVASGRRKENVFGD